VLTLVFARLSCLSDLLVLAATSKRLAALVAAARTVVVLPPHQHRRLAAANTPALLDAVVASVVHRLPGAVSAPLPGRPGQPCARR
jgi:hypothetical protein